MSYLRCPLCNGSKKFLGMGAMLKDCTECDGIGYIDRDCKDSDVEVVAEPISNDEIDDNKTAKPKRGRPRAK